MLVALLQYTSRLELFTSVSVLGAEQHKEQQTDLPQAVWHTSWRGTAGHLPSSLVLSRGKGRTGLCKGTRALPRTGFWIRSALSWWCRLQPCQNELRSSCICLYRSSLGRYSQILTGFSAGSLVAANWGKPALLSCSTAISPQHALLLLPLPTLLPPLPCRYVLLSY